VQRRLRHHSKAQAQPSAAIRLQTIQ